jgi:hypothetical protein
VSATSTPTGTLPPAELTMVKVGSGEASVPAGISASDDPSLWANAEAAVASSIPNVSVTAISRLFMKPPLEFLVNRIQAVKY